MHRGKVRDTFALPTGDLAIVASDRLSAFDAVVGLIPDKGQILTEISAWWNRALEAVVPSHLVGLADPNITIARRAEPLPVEVVVRGFITGVTSTSIWPRYQAGQRTMYGLTLPDGLQRNDPLPQPIITPTTKAAVGAHDEPISSDEIVSSGLINGNIWSQVREAALTMFAEGQRHAEQAGLVLVDTKYEFGLLDGAVIVIDEVHTPDSSRYWRRTEEPGTEPVHLDKELVRRWFVDQGYRGDGPIPPLSHEITQSLASAYREVWERLHRAPFAPAAQPAKERVERVLAGLADSGSDPGSTGTVCAAEVLR